MLVVLCVLTHEHCNHMSPRVSVFVVSALAPTRYLGQWVLGGWS